MRSLPVTRSRPRHAFSLFSAFALLIALLTLASVGVDRSAALDGETEAVPGELIVGFTSSATAWQEQRAVEKARGEVEDRIESVDAALVTVDPSRTEDASERLLRNPAVDFVEPNYVLRASRIPNDRNFGEQWGLRNLGHFDGKAGADISATAAWDVTPPPTRSSRSWTRVSRTSTPTWPAMPGGTRPTRPTGWMTTATGSATTSSGPTSMPTTPTLTTTAVTARTWQASSAARATTPWALPGVSWDVNVMALEFLDENGEGNTADAANAIDFAVAHGARIVNASWGGPSFSQALYGSIRRAGERGTLVVAAAGNEGVNADTRPDYPAAFDLPNIVSVAATDRTDRLLDFSNYGAKSVDLAAPGDDIYLDRSALTDPSGYAAFSGTSMAAPFVSGAAALYLSKFPQASVDQIKAALLQSTDQPAHPHGQDRQRRAPERRAHPRRSVTVHATRRGHDAPFGLLPHPPPLPARNAQAGARLQVAARPRLGRHQDVPPLPERPRDEDREGQGRPRAARTRGRARSSACAAASTAGTCGPGTTPVTKGRCPADDFSDRAVQIRDRHRDHPTGARGAVTARETLARELTNGQGPHPTARRLNDAELRRRSRPADRSARLGPRAHRAEQEELSLLRGGTTFRFRPGILEPPGRAVPASTRPRFPRASHVDPALLRPEEAR